MSTRNGRLAQGGRLVVVGVALLWGCRSQVPSSTPLGGIEYDVALAPPVSEKPKANHDAAVGEAPEQLQASAEPEDASETIPVLTTGPEPVSVPTPPPSAPHYVFRPLAKGWVMTEESHFSFAMKITVAVDNRPPIAMSVVARRKSVLEIKAVDKGVPTEFDIAHSDARLEANGMGTSKTKPEETDGKRYSVRMQGGVPDVRSASGSRPPDEEEREIAAEARGFYALSLLGSAANGAPIVKGQRVQLNADIFQKMFGSTEKMKIKRAEATVEEVGKHGGKDAVRASVQLDFSLGEGGIDIEAEMKGDAWVDSSSLRLLDVTLKGHGKGSPKGFPSDARVDVGAELEVGSHYTYQEPALPEASQKP
ncbi:MAG: hypothetical protein SFV15_07955 [Polyangiaceae bacterium]|nr:hypothetical protein [Polyangiaceae bacterium]